MPTPIVLNIAYEVPLDVGQKFCDLSGSIADRMQAAGTKSHLILGKPYDGEKDTICIPHLTAYRDSRSHAVIPALVIETRKNLSGIAPIRVVGREWSLNPHGAVELLFDVDSEKWDEAQMQIITATRNVSGRADLALDPSGIPLEELYRKSNPAQQRNLRTYRYEQIGEARNPHITLAWPYDIYYRYPLEELPNPKLFNFSVSSVGVFRESPRHGACIENFGSTDLSLTAAQTRTPTHD
jgi:hypothetical protein